MQTIAVIDYGASNLRSVSKALEHVADGHYRISVSAQAEAIFAADRIVFPGQGAMGQCMRSIHERGLDEVLRECIYSKPFLGICLGLQSLMEHSEEDDGTRGLGIIFGGVKKFTADATDASGGRLKIPHMGWNRVVQRGDHALWQGINSGERFYFVHSYYVQPLRRVDIAAVSEYAVEFTAAVARDNLFATQFHPEKSQWAGLKLLANFLQWSP